jgi:hypothetical protein
MCQKRVESTRQSEKLVEDDMRISLTIYDIPVSLLAKFSENINRLHYPGGVSEAVKDLIRKAVMEQELASDTLFNAV